MANVNVTTILEWFQREVTGWKLTLFDILFGMVAPVLCLYFDPIIFKGGGRASYLSSESLSTLRSLSGSCRWRSGLWQDV